jgi:hypothetical protein
VRRLLGEHWALPLGFGCERIAEHARLQTWTLKPAWIEPPVAPPLDGARKWLPEDPAAPENGDNG